MAKANRPSASGQPEPENHKTSKAKGKQGAREPQFDDAPWKCFLRAINNFKSDLGDFASSSKNMELR
jgi:hypothetical protein